MPVLDFLMPILSDPVFYPSQLTPTPQVTPLSEIETYGGKRTLKINPKKVEKQVKQTLRGAGSKRIEEIKTLTAWQRHPETPEKNMQLRGSANPTQEKLEQKKKPRQASATEEPMGKKSKVTLNEASEFRSTKLNAGGHH